MNCARTLKEEIHQLRKEIKQLNETLSQKKCGGKPKQKTIRERLSSRMY